MRVWIVWIVWIGVVCCVLCAVCVVCAEEEGVWMGVDRMGEVGCDHGMPTWRPFIGTPVPHHTCKVTHSGMRANGTPKIFWATFPACRRKAENAKGKLWDT